MQPSSPLLTIGLAFLLLALALTVLRLIFGPTRYDRILAMNLFGTLTAALIALISFINNDTMYLDIALSYGVMNFIATIGLLRYQKMPPAEETQNA